MKNRLIPLGERLLLRKRKGYWDGDWPVEEYFSDWTFPSSQPSQLLGECGLWIDCLLPSAQEAFYCYRPQFAPCCLTRTHVILRHIASSILQQDKSVKTGIKNKRLKAGWDNEYLAKVLFG
jgi:hypothetical protein